MDEKNIFESQKKESAVDFVINSFKRLLLSKKLLPGDSIPNENELAESFNVSRGSIREAMKILSAFGIVEIKRGNGTYIAKSINKTLFDPFLFNLILSGADVKELVELREMMELQLVGLIVKNADDAGIRDIEEAYLHMQRTVESDETADPKALMECDIQFHTSLGRASKNILVEKIYGFILELFTPYIEKTYSYEKNEVNALALHRDILEAIRNRDIDRALESTRKSIEEWRRLFTGSFQ